MPLYLVAVPLGNLEDITLRAMRILREADAVLCEDTRRSGHLLELLNLPSKHLVSLHEYNETERVPQILSWLEEGQSLALITDAGTPCISDPGFKLVRAISEQGGQVVPIPGPCAAITALCASGLPTDRFRFIGFPSTKQGEARQMLIDLKEAEETLIFYVSPHQMGDFMPLCAEVLGSDRPAVLARELTKIHEEFRRGTLKQLCDDPGNPLGERVLLIGGCPEEAPATTESIESCVRMLLQGGYTVSRAAKEAAARCGCKRKEAYRVALQIAGVEGSDEMEEIK